MDNNKDFIKFFKLCCNTLFYSWWFPVVITIFLLLVYITKKVNIFLLIGIEVIIIIAWLIKLIYIPNNKTKKYGIVFIIKNGEMYNDDIYKMFKKIQFELQDNFKILVFNDNFIRKINEREKCKEKFFKKNYHMIINMFSLSGKENSENVCSLTNKNITFLTQGQKLDDEIINNLQKDFHFGFKKMLKLSEKNSFTDINENAGVMTLSIRYFTSIIYIIFNQMNLAEKQLNSMNFDNVNNSDKIVQYLRRNVVRRYAEIYYVKIIKKLNSYEYLYNEKDLNELIDLLKKFSVFVDSDSSLTDLRNFKNDVKAKVCFAKGDYSNSLSILYKMKNRNNNDYSILLSKAFVEINLENIKGFETYKKVSKRKDINMFIIESCINFIDNSLNNNTHNKDLLILCKGILIYYWQDKTKGNELINQSIINIKNQKIIDYVKVRFKIK